MASISRVFSIVSSFTFLLIFLRVVEAKSLATDGFTIDLIHRDSPLSPYYDPSISSSQRLNKAFLRSFARAASASAMATPTTIQSQISSNGGEYLMKLSIGTPPVELLAIADTGSDLAWIQCKPCSECYKQNAPFFDPKRSSTYRNVACQSPYCEALGSPSCDGTCQYSQSYGDRSVTIGDLAVETFTLGSVSIPKVVFGCGHSNQGTFNETGAGIIGLGGGSLSIVKQLNKYVNGKFSYCLVPVDSSPNLTSKLSFGRDAIVSGPEAVSTPLAEKEPDTFYFLTLEAISVGNKRLSYKKVKEEEEGNIIIDSGTTLTLLPNDFYQELVTTLAQSISAQNISDPQEVFSLCYRSNSLDVNKVFPEITFHFTDADVGLKPSSTFLQVEDGLICLTIVPSDDFAILGNLSQMDYLVGYDLVGRKVSFRPTDCTKQS